MLMYEFRVPRWAGAALQAAVMLGLLGSEGAAAETGKGWVMAGANPQRTRWVPEEVKGRLQPAWYCPIEGYIPQEVQVVAARGKVYIASARGLYALNAKDGTLVWRFDTELPPGNAPTIDGGTCYVGGMDRRLHALDADTGKPLWSFDGALAGYRTNPLVVEGKVILGNRGARGSLWSYGNGLEKQCPIIPYDGMVYSIKSNAVVAFGPGSWNFSGSATATRNDRLGRLTVGGAAQ